MMEIKGVYCLNEKGFSLYILGIHKIRRMG